MISLSTSQAVKLRTLFESLVPLLSEGTLVFSKEGMRVKGSSIQAYASVFIDGNSEIEYVYDSTGIIKKSIKPNFKSLGKKLGKNMKACSQALAAFGQDDIANIERNGKYTLKLNGEPFEFSSGTNFHDEDLYSAVLGSQVALTLNLQVGDKIAPTHGADDGKVHDPFQITGILSRTDTPIDRGVFVNMEGFGSHWRISSLGSWHNLEDMSAGVTQRPSLCSLEVLGLGSNHTSLEALLGHLSVVIEPEESPHAHRVAGDEFPKGGLS